MRRILVPLDGSPLSETAVPYAVELASDLGVRASHGRRGAAERRRGSVADKVLRGSSVPVLVVGPAVLQNPPTGPVGVRSLVLPLDGSRESESAVGGAVEIARAMGAQITLLRVVPPVVSG